jgi:hypothetical protein
MALIQSFLLALILILTVQYVSPIRADSLPIRTLAKGPFSGIQEARQEVIKDEAAWEKTWAKHLAAAKGSTNRPAVDFSKEMVIIATFGQQHTGGYAIEISQVEAVGDKLKVSITRTTPPPGSMALQSLTAPFHVVAVSRNDLKPEFTTTTISRKKPGSL